MSTSAPDTSTADAAALQDAASELTVAAAGADAVARTLLLASVAPQLVGLPDIESHEVDWLEAAAEDLRTALNTFASRVGPELEARLRERIDWAEARARHDRTEAMRAAEGARSMS